MNYIKKYQNAQDISVSLGNNYSEDHLMHILLDKFHQGREVYCTDIKPPGRLKKRGKFYWPKIFIYLISTYWFLNIDSSAGYGKNNWRENIVQKNALFVEMLTILKKMF